MTDWHRLKPLKTQIPPHAEQTEYPDIHQKRPLVPLWQRLFFDLHIIVIDDLCRKNRGRHEQEGICLKGPMEIQPRQAYKEGGYPAPRT